VIELHALVGRLNLTWRAKLQRRRFEAGIVGSMEIQSQTCRPPESY
jgi:hypothetical protein